ncbi:sigma-54-dependent Fis family transcriptional regulator [Hydrogenophilus thermoluteolus]|uniref:sigma-54-dependent transcriptional regulator n=1 Tax=Hydrogenophilus thermoluteolus TaxID=297 RepID=UPI0024A1FD6F|nr:sigma-54 dependent transcriptional regulator [Hydrogenophilus thermoluteolus]GLW61575.1 sigma-54-dependent Fis family transcriptional regulator [Hydrogenophilus thermoluteolus]
MSEHSLPILIVEDDPDLREALELILTAQGYRVLVAASGPEALELLDRHAVAMVVTDLKMAPMDGLALLDAVRQKLPHLPVALMTAYGDVPAAVRAMKSGACEFLLKPFESRQLLAVIERYAQWGGDGAVADLIAEDPKTQAVRMLAERVAATDATVLLTGESGVGKEVFARLIHAVSPRKTGPFVAINCAAIPESLLEATLFGHEKGAFTGAATAQPGKFEQAQGGTILLDEISEMPLLLQAKLLRVLQEKEVERLGGKKAIPLDVRVIATTNRNLSDEVAAGRFREDLFYRLNVFPIAIPPLRDRPADIVPLARYFLSRLAAEWGRVVPGITEEAERILLTYSWPGNVRELHNTLQRALILAPGNVIDGKTLRHCLPNDAPVTDGLDPVEKRATPQWVAGKQAEGDSLPRRDTRTNENGQSAVSLRDWEREQILRILAEEGGSRKRAAQRLGMPERTLRYRLRKYREAGFDVPEA